MGRRKKKTLKNIVFDIYRELYANATPSADFDELYENAPINDNGQKVINFDNYEINGKIMEEIIQKHCKKNKISKREENMVSVTIYLGASPRTKKEDNEETNSN